MAPLSDVLPINGAQVYVHKSNFNVVVNIVMGTSASCHVDVFLRHRFAVESSPPSYDIIEQKTQTGGLF